MSEIFLTACNCTADDKLEFTINGAPVPANTIKSVWNREGRPEKFGRTLAPHMSFMWRLTSPPATFGDNTLGATLTAVAGESTEDIVIDEVEVTVISA